MDDQVVTTPDDADDTEGHATKPGLRFRPGPEAHDGVTGHALESAPVPEDADDAAGHALPGRPIPPR